MAAQRWTTRNQERKQRQERVSSYTQEVIFRLSQFEKPLAPMAQGLFLYFLSSVLLPPSTCRTWPVIQPESFESKNPQADQWVHARNRLSDFWVLGHALGKRRVGQTRRNHVDANLWRKLCGDALCKAL